MKQIIKTKTKKQYQIINQSIDVISTYIFKLLKH